MRKLRRWAALKPSDRRAFAEAWALLVIAGLGLRWLGLQRVERLLGRLSGRSASAALPPPEETERLRRLVAQAAANHLGSPRCLPRALVLRSMLQRRGWGSQLRIGVRRAGRGIEGHAWLESDGRPLAGEISGANGFAALEAVGAGR